MTDFHKPRPYTDASLRRLHYGPIEPMDYDDTFQWWKGAVAVAALALIIWGAFS